MIARRVMAVIASLMVTTLSYAQAVSAELEGRWQVVSAVDSGRAAPPEEIREIVFTITSREISYSVGEKRRGWEYEVDASRKPKWIDLTSGGRTALGIYELRGDELKICYPEGRPGERATAFESKEESANDVLIVLRRIRG